MKNRRLRNLLLVVCAVVVLALRAVPAGAGPCTNHGGVGSDRGIVCYTCCTCCVFNDGTIDCVCTQICGV